MPFALALPDPSIDRAALDRDRPLVTEAVLRGERDRLVRLVRRLLAWPSESAEVEDVVQEALLRAWTRREQLRDEEALRGWLQRIAVHAARNHLRSRRRRSWLSTFGTLGKEAGDVPDLREDSDDSSDRTRSALARLGTRDRELLVLRYLEGVPGEDLRAILGIRRAALDARLARARRRLRDELMRMEDGR